MFVRTGFRYSGVLFHTVYYYWVEEYRLLYQGLRYIEVRYIGFHCSLTDWERYRRYIVRLSISTGLMRELLFLFVCR